MHTPGNEFPPMHATGRSPRPRPRSTRVLRATRRHDRRLRTVRRTLTVVLALGLAFGTVHVLSPADADSTVMRQVSNRSDAGVLDVNGDGTGDIAPFGQHRGSL